MHFLKSALVWWTPFSKAGDKWALNFAAKLMFKCVFLVIVSITPSEWVSPEWELVVWLLDYAGESHWSLLNVQWQTGRCSSSAVMGMASWTRLGKGWEKKKKKEEIVSYLRSAGSWYHLSRIVLWAVPGVWSQISLMGTPSQSDVAAQPYRNRMGVSSAQRQKKGYKGHLITVFSFPMWRL